MSTIGELAVWRIALGIRCLIEWRQRHNTKNTAIIALWCWSSFGDGGIDCVPRKEFQSS